MVFRTKDGDQRKIQYRNMFSTASKHFTHGQSHLSLTYIKLSSKSLFHVNVWKLMNLCMCCQLCLNLKRHFSKWRHGMAAMVYTGDGKPVVPFKDRRERAECNAMSKVVRLEYRKWHQSETDATWPAENKYSYGRGLLCKDSKRYAPWLFQCWQNGAFYIEDIPSAPAVNT